MYNSSYYSINNLIKNQINNERFSDVIFLVENKKIYAHKMILASASSVFEVMFYGILKENCNQPIHIADLTYVGFLNMIK